MYKTLLKLYFPAKEPISHVGIIKEQISAVAIDDAAKASMEMAGTVSNIRRAADETTMATEGVARQAETLKMHAQTLADLMSMFKLESEQ